MKVIEIVGEPYTIYVDENYWDFQFENDSRVKYKFIKPLFINQQMSCIIN